ncbi:MAG: hypothetical protein H0W61_03345 [Bacteroidetes bacterium]|nr:hypothetical protein [Bacteroidota bacterium]
MCSLKMEQIKRNSREFKVVKELLVDYAESATRKKVIKLYALKPYQSLEERILINDLKKDVAILYDLSYESILEYIRDRSKKLFREDKVALYYFKSSSKSKWIEYPFELTGKLKKQVMP